MKWIIIHSALCTLAIRKYDNIPSLRGILSTLSHVRQHMYHLLVRWFLLTYMPTPSCVLQQIRANGKEAMCVSTYRHVRNEHGCAERSEAASVRGCEHNYVHTYILRSTCKHVAHTRPRMQPATRNSCYIRHVARSGVAIASERSERSTYMYIQHYKTGGRV